MTENMRTYHLMYGPADVWKRVFVEDEINRRGGLVVVVVVKKEDGEVWIHERARPMKTPISKYPASMLDTPELLVETFLIEQIFL
jgi:hypothetical protein